MKIQTIENEDDRALNKNYLELENNEFAWSDGNAFGVRSKKKTPNRTEVSDESRNVRTDRFSVGRHIYDAPPTAKSGLSEKNYKQKENRRQYRDERACGKIFG